MTEHDTIDDLFREGLRDAARPHVRAAIEHRDAMPRSLPVVRARRTRPVRVIAIAAAAAAAVAGVAYATPKVINTRHVSVQHDGPDRPPVTTTKQHTQSENHHNTRTPPPVTSAPANSSQQPGGIQSTPPPPPPPAPVSDDPGAAPAFTIANHVLVTLDDHGVHASAARADEGLVEIGFQDARTHRASGQRVRLSVPRVGGLIAPGQAAQLHLDEVGVDYVLAPSVDGAVAGQTTLAVDVPVLANHGEPNSVVTIDIDAMWCVNRDWRAGDEPLATGDAAAPATRHWTTILSTGNQKPTFVVQSHDGRAHHLTLRGVGAYHQGDIAAGGDHQNFQPPSGARVFSKYVLSYDGFADGTHEFAVWVI